MEQIRLALGDKLELELYNSKGEHIKPVFVSQYVNQFSDGTFEILAPIHKGKIYPVHAETRLDVVYEKEGSLFGFLATVLERRTSGGIHSLRIASQSGERRVQRRTFFRFSYIAEVQYRFVKDRTQKERGEYKLGIMKDISGGGICLLTNEKPACGLYLDGTFNIGRKIHFIGRVVHVKRLQYPCNYKYEAGVEFSDIAEKDREEIIGFIFDLERQLLKRGWAEKKEMPAENKEGQRIDGKKKKKS